MARKSGTKQTFTPFEKLNISLNDAKNDLCMHDAQIWFDRFVFFQIVQYKYVAQEADYP